jgi:hypothetical protein
MITVNFFTPGSKVGEELRLMGTATLHTLAIHIEATKRQTLTTLIHRSSRFSKADLDDPVFKCTTLEELGIVDGSVVNVVFKAKSKFRRKAPITRAAHAGNGDSFSLSNNLRLHYAPGEHTM